MANLHKIKHWTICEGDYRKITNRKATWFIDPPYVRTGHYYMSKTPLDYNELAQWSRERQGQVIVCEQDGAAWLSFTPLAEIAIAGHARTCEVVWCR